MMMRNSPMGRLVSGHRGLVLMYYGDMDSDEVPISGS